MRTRLAKYRKTEPDPRANYDVGCVILGSPFFLEERDWIPAPASFHPNIVQGKTYRLEDTDGRAVWSALMTRRRAESVEVVREESPMFGDSVTVTRRLGQGTFRLLVTDRYERRCAVTQEKVLPVLEAAHIRPVATGGKHRIDNGVLLRSDLHTLFDAGYVTIDPTHKLRVSRKLEDEFDNGKHYYALDRTSIWLPTRAEDRPAREFLEWHADSVFLG